MKMDFPDAITAYANTRRFLPGETLEFRAVQSRMLLCCYDGKGCVVVNGKSFGRLLLAEMARTVKSHEGDVPIGGTFVPSLRVALEHLREHHSKPICLEDLAKSCGCCPSNLIRLFRKHLHTTPMLHLQRIRLEEAARLLCSSRLRIGEIAEAVGIGDPFYFSRLFRKRFGMTATAYRAKGLLFP
jgi:transcriptional regulator GlxA family with amidase domain